MVQLNIQDEYYTPKYIVDYFFPNGFDYDPATSEQQAKNLNISNYDTKYTNGLSQDWSIYNNIWINPPFSLKYEFLKKAKYTFDKANNNIFILLPINFLTTKQFFDCDIKGTLYIPKGRINFISGISNKVCKSPAFGCVIINLGSTNEIKYIENFRR